MNKGTDTHRLPGFMYQLALTPYILAIQSYLCCNFADKQQQPNTQKSASLILRR